MAKIKLISISIVAIIGLFSINNCTVFQFGYYNLPQNNSTNESGYLIRGSGWKGLDSYYTLNDVNQFENKEFIIAVKVNNHYTRHIATGILGIPFIPMFGYTEGYKDSDPLLIKIAIFVKKNKVIKIQPCKILLNKKNNKYYTPTKFNYSFNGNTNNNYVCTDGKTRNKEISIDYSFKDIVTFEIIYKAVCNPSDNCIITLPKLKYNNSYITIPSFKFKEGSGCFWGSIL